MDLLSDKFKEVLRATLPIVLLVIVLAQFFVHVPYDMMLRFLIGACFLVLGLTIFLFGVEVGMAKIGDLMGRFMANQEKNKMVLFFAFLIGFVVTIAEPDLLVLGNQISEVTGNDLTTSLIVFTVSVGVGLMISGGVYRLVKSIKLKHFFSIIYGLILFLSLFSSNAFIAMAFDASGATTGALTTPFILAIGASVSSRKGSKYVEKDAFGLVGAMSTGPILSVLMLSLLLGSNFSGSDESYQYTEGIVAPFFSSFGHTLWESMIALIPILLLFFYMNMRYIHLTKKKFLNILKGAIYTLIGLTLFIIGVNQGFMDMGRYLATHLAQAHATLLPWIGMVMGLLVVLAEPAVHVLSDQVEEVTGGYINNKIILMALSIGVGLALCLSMFRMMIPGLQLWHFLLPGFGLAILLSFIVPDIFSGIAFDAGGVASGPMTATFVLSFSQGVSATLPQADILVDGFGIIAMVAMVPILTIQILGLLLKIKNKKIGVN